MSNVNNINNVPSDYWTWSASERIRHAIGKDDYNDIYLKSDMKNTILSSYEEILNILIGGTLKDYRAPSRQHSEKYKLVDRHIFWYKESWYKNQKLHSMQRIFGLLLQCKINAILKKENTVWLD